MERAVPIVLIVILVTGGALAWGRLAWRRQSARLTARIVDPGPVAPPPTAGARVELPPPVAAYLARAIPSGRMPDPWLVARVRHEGEFFMGEGRGWRPFRSLEVFAALRPGFVWDARIRLAPGLSVFVRDAYVRGEGRMEARLAGLVPVMTAEDRVELRQAALQRYLAETAWFPMALGAAGAVEWRGIDDRSAEARLVDGDAEAILTFHFGEAGLLERVSADARFREAGGRYLPTPWEGRFRAYRPYGDVLIPAEAEVAWIDGGERRPYWRGRILSVTYEPAL